VITSRENPQGIPDFRARSLGKLKFKMRLRKPISEALRFYRDQNEIRNIEKFTQMQQEDSRPRKKMITIDVYGA
jgi:hypothetical protein